MPIFVKSSLPRLVLASASPRRLDICHSIGLKPIVITGSCQEVQEGLPTAVVCENSRRKALAAASLAEPQDLLIASDTIVVRGEQILGKPRNQEDACAMLLSLKNSWHQVYSGL
ncbi:MAG: Maf family protein, partial [Clostridiales bacterium]